MIRVVGTAGHVDHGKSALVEALTGTHPDRLREEREREMTIDLGFAWLTLPDGTEVGIVDVPGHRDFIDNMLAGAGGFQAAILVVAADEGVMPQTREHLAILDLLEIPRLVVAVSKIDAVEDDEWIPLVEEDIRRCLAPTRYDGAPLVRVSARHREGLDALRQTLADILGQVPGPRDIGRARLPIDRAFTMSGFGTVITGTLRDGILHSGEEVDVLPAGVRGRIRGLQTNRRAVEQALPGSRVAVNLAGIDVRQVARGEVLAAPGAYTPTRRIDAHVRLLPDSQVPLRHGQSMKVYLGAADVVAKIRLLEADEIGPGESGWAQLVLAGEAVAAEQDRFILRRPAPPATLGGGVVVAAHASRAHRRRDARVIDGLEQIRRGRPADRLFIALVHGGPLRQGRGFEAAGLSEAEGAQAEAELLADGRALFVGAGDTGGQIHLVATEWWKDVRARAEALLNEYHADHPLRTGMPREELRSRLGVPSRQSDVVLAGLADEGALIVLGPRVARSGFGPRLSEEQARQVDELRARFRASPMAPPTPRDCRSAVGDEVWGLLTARGEFVEVSEDVVFAAEDYRTVVEQIRQMLGERGTITVAEVRDRFHTSRKYALALLEHLDALGVTVRVGDERRLKTVPDQNPGSSPG